jgi:predicted dehydrogenase
MSRKVHLPRREFIAQATGTGIGLVGLSGGSSAQGAQAGGEKTSPLPPVDGQAMDQAIRDVLAARRIGEPVFIRCTLHGQGKAKNLQRQLTLLIDLARQWMGQKLVRMQAVGSTRSGQMSLALEFEGGATGLVSVARGQAPGHGLDLFLLGNHGAIYHDPGAGVLWDTTVALAGKPVGAELEKVIDRALRSGKPETVEGGG